jgi:hypothetical protein
MEAAPLRFVEATTAEGVWALAVRSSDGVVGHIFRVGGEYAYFAGAFNGLTATFTDPNLERLKERIVASRRSRRGRRMDARRRDGPVAKRRAR